MNEEPHDDAVAVERLESIPVPVPIKAYDVDARGSSTVRLFFRGGESGGWPGGDICQVTVLEGDDRVSIGLVRRHVYGEAPDGTMYGESLAMGPPVSLDVSLLSPLGTRDLLDASSGETLSRVDRPSEELLPAEAMGTPLWRGA